MNQQVARTQPLNASTHANIKRHQLHLWIGHQEYAFLRTLARVDDEPMARIIRRLIRQLRAAVEKNRHRNGMQG
jgi:hypothetical protein